MDPELQKGFQDLQAQFIESRSKIAHIDTCQKITTLDAKTNETILELFTGSENIEDKFIYEPVGRMLVKRGGIEAKNFIEARDKQYKEKLKTYKEVKDICTKRYKDTENSIRELVNKKLNKNEPQDSKAIQNADKGDDKSAGDSKASQS